MSTTELPSGATEQEMVIDGAGEAASEDQTEQPPYILTLLIPRQSFVDLPPAPPVSEDGEEQASSSLFYEIPMPCSLQDSVQEIRQVVNDAAEAFWLGSFGLVPVVQKEEGGEWADYRPSAEDGEPKDLLLGKEGQLSDFSELSAAFGYPSAEGLRHGLKTVLAPYAPTTLASHLIRLRDTLFATQSSMAGQGGYDPSSLAIGAGASNFLALRDQAKSEEKPLTNFHYKDVSLFDAYTPLKESSTPATTPIPCIKSLAVSPWSPPPHSWRLRGHLNYLSVTTLEGETITIAGTASGFYVTKITSSTFDPTPREKAAAHAHSIWELLCTISPLFRVNVVKLFEAQQPSLSIPDIFAHLPISHGIPAAPWLIPSPTHSSDSFRSQLAYLVTGTTTAELLPPARDWNDEYLQYKELPKSNIRERQLRDGMLNRIKADYAQAAARGIQGISRGDIPCINPNDADPPTYLHNNMLFTKNDESSKGYEHLGGTEAVRATSNKDLTTIGLLEKHDIDRLHTLLTVIVDYRGSRWLVQSVLPGLFRARDAEEQAKVEDKETEDAEVFREDADPAISDSFKIIYGSAFPDDPDKSYRASPRFHSVAEKAAQIFHLAEHDVTDDEGKTSKMWLSKDVHGIAGSDGRNYLIDTWRMHVVDVEFLEKDANKSSPLLSAGTPQANGVHDIPAYPHRTPFLRLELTEAYHSSKLHKWIEEQVAEQQAANEGKPDTTASVNTRDFDLSYNPDAFVERRIDEKNKDAKNILIYDPEEPSTKNVRDASRYLRETVIPTFVASVASEGIYFTGGSFLTRILHRRGINLRYLGLLAQLAAAELAKLNAEEKTTGEAALALGMFGACLQDEMLARAGKHVLRDLLRNSSVHDHSHVISHFFNCLLTPSTRPEPLAITRVLPLIGGQNREWAQMTRASLQNRLVAEVEARFRFQLAQDTFADNQLPRFSLFRDISLRLGVQFELRRYAYLDPREAPAAAVHHSTDDEKAPENAADKNDVSTAPKKKKKAKKAAVAQPNGAAPDLESDIFRPEDILNLAPLVKATPALSGDAEETFEAGRRLFNEGAIDQGNALINDALMMYEQAMGSIHPELAGKYYSAGLTYHNRAGGLNQSLHLHENTVEAFKGLSGDALEEAKKQFKSVLIDNVPAFKADMDHWAQMSTRMIRQSLIINERMAGVDDSDVLRQYSDLQFLEYSVGNPAVASRLAIHALRLWAGTSRTYHPTMLSILNTAATVVQSTEGPQASLHLQEQCATLAADIHGRNSAFYGHTQFMLSQTSVMSGQMDKAIEYAAEALKVFTATSGPGAKETKEAEQLLLSLKHNKTEVETKQKAREERLKRKYPKLAAMNLIQPGASNFASSSSGQNRPTQAEHVLIAAATAAEEAKKAHGEKGNLTLEELVAYIDGTGAASKKTAQPTPPSAPAASKPKRKMHRVR